MPQRYWLFKSEPGAYSFDDLVRDKRTEWEGVRNFKAGGYLRNEITEGDGVLFYHSSTKPMAVVGIATVARAGYPDPEAWDPTSRYYDPKSTPEKPLWYMVDIAPVEQLKSPVTLETIKKTPALANMVLIKAGRLSVLPVTPEEWKVIVEMGNA